MPTPEALVSLAIAELPTILAIFRELLKKRDPDAPDPTDAEVFAAFERAFQSSKARDEEWLAAHGG